MKYRMLDSVVLTHDLPEFGLRSGDLGAVVETYEPDGIEVEFVKASGETLAVVTIAEKEVRPVESADIISVRSLSHAA
ncbi:MAG: DUF4926 domain-containing protein [Thermodesulfovibrionales bacterium]|nr:DUF4926 domain-containing protein [Thermodesulfovibrionales bacterium]